jgi:hypothetical protein
MPTLRHPEEHEIFLAFSVEVKVDRHEIYPSCWAIFFATFFCSFFEWFAVVVSAHPSIHMAMGRFSRL